MTTHEFARALTDLARIFKAAPNQDLKGLDLSKNWLVSGDLQRLSVNLHTLSELSKVDKAQWRSLIEHYNFPIEIRPRDASRDILGKLLKFLEENPSAAEYLRSRVRHSPEGTSPELMRALSTLLR